MQGLQVAVAAQVSAGQWLCCLNPSAGTGLSHLATCMLQTLGFMCQVLHSTAKPSAAITHLLCRPVLPALLWMRWPRCLLQQGPLATAACLGAWWPACRPGRFWLKLVLDCRMPLMPGLVGMAMTLTLLAPAQGHDRLQVLCISAHQPQTALPAIIAQYVQETCSMACLRCSCTKAAQQQREPRCLIARRARDAQHAPQQAD